MMDHVAGRTRASVLNRQADRQADMQADDGEQRHPRTPQGHGHVAQECGIRIQGVCPSNTCRFPSMWKTTNPASPNPERAMRTLLPRGGENVTEESNHAQRIKSRRCLHLYSARFHSSSVCRKRAHETDVAAAQ